MQKLEFTFLTKEQCYGLFRLAIIKKYGRKAAITDFAILLGGHVYFECTSEGKSLKNRAGSWWTKTPDGAKGACGIGIDDDVEWPFVTSRNVGIRPVFDYSSIQKTFETKAKRFFEVEYGEYPQTVVSRDLNEILERAYSDKTISPTGKKYTTDSVSLKDTNIYFEAREHIEYEYNGEKYIRFVADSNCRGLILSDWRNAEEGKPYWIKVEPIKWMIDEKADIALSKKILFAGVQFNNIKNYEGNFKKTFVYWFMKKYFSKDIIPSKTNAKAEPAEPTDFVRKELEKATKSDVEKKQVGNNWLRTKIQQLKQLIQEYKEEQQRGQELSARAGALDTQINQKKSEIQADNALKRTGDSPYVKQ